MVISIPAYYTEQERKGLLDACRIAEINCLKLMNEHVSVALSYGIFRRKEFDATPRYVAFVDVGHSHTSAYIAKFTNEKLTVVH